MASIYDDATIARRAAEQHRQNVDYLLDDLVLDPENRAIKPVDISEAIASSGMTLAVDQANTFTVAITDADRALLRGDFLTGWLWGRNADSLNETKWVLDGRKITATIDDLELRLQKVSKASEVLTLTLEEEAVAKLREHKGARKVFRDSGVTRAEFVKMLCDAAGVPTHIPELHVKQPVAPSPSTPDSTKRLTGSKGLDPAAEITVKGQPADREQRANIEVVLEQGDKLRAPNLAMLAALCAGIEESNFKKSASNSVGKGHHGVFQSDTIPASDLTAQAYHFFKGGRSFLAGGAIRMARANPGYSPGLIATKVEISDGSAAFYDAARPEAEKILHAYKPGFSGTDITTTVVKPYAFKRGATETSWDAIQRLAAEVNWRAFVRRGVLWYVSEEYLFQQKTQITVRERTTAPASAPATQLVDNIDFDVDLGARDLVTELTVTARANLWVALQGMTIGVRGVGPADGRWIVSQVDKATLAVRDSNATITCHKPLPTKPEPANETQQQTVTIGGAAQAGGPLGKATAFYIAAKGISDANGPYVFGGGHGKPLRQVSVRAGTDCSSSVSLALYKAGLFEGRKEAIVSGDFGSWGKPGKGRYLTVWYNAGHVWVELNLPGHKVTRFDTSPHGSGGNGPHLRYTERSTAGFTPRQLK